MSSSVSASLSNPTPLQLHCLVLDYLCHNCYTRTASAFNRDSTIRLLDPDGDEILGHPAKQHSGVNERPSSSAESFEILLNQVKLRQEIRTHILSGRVEDAIVLLNAKFPSVLSEDIAVTQAAEPRITANNMDYVSSTSTEPAHLLLNLRILAFSEACRTIPLEYPPKSAPVPTDAASHPPFETPTAIADQCVDNNGQQLALLLRAQKLLAQLNTLPNAADRATYLEELKNVAGLLAYKIPEKSSVSKYLTLERREAVADQINRAILKRTGLPLISSVELVARYTHLLWQAANQHGVKARPGAISPTRSSKLSSTETDDAVVSPFDLHQFLGLKP